jgi:uncharacterized membrane protein YhiD involved in acid resistance
MTITIEQAAIDLAVACGLSAVIGFERQWRNRVAGYAPTRWWLWARRAL